MQLLTVDSLRKPREPYSEAIFLSVDAKQRWVLNGKKISPSEIPRVLSDLGGGHSNCVVFLDVDKHLPYSVAIQAIDSVEGIGFKVIFTTPGSKENIY